MAFRRGARDPRGLGVRLEWATNVFNALEFVITITLGIRAQSLALIAFGLDSLIEIFASSVVIQNLNDRGDDSAHQRTHKALHLIAVAFWLLAAILVAASIRALIREQHPAGSPVGIAYLAVAATAMFGLAVLKRRVARDLGSEPLRAEAAMTFLDGCLSTSVLTALVLNGVLGWWWADAGAALVVAGAAFAEGVRHWHAAAPHPASDTPAAG